MMSWADICMRCRGGPGGLHSLEVLEWIGDWRLIIVDDIRCKEQESLYSMLPHRRVYQLI